MNEHPMMICGHAANSRHRLPDGTWEPACVICDCFTQQEIPPSFEGRIAYCTYYRSCHSEAQSDPERLAFFEYRGPGSHWAEDRCTCGWYRNAHPSQGGTGCYKNTDRRLPHLCEDSGEIFTPVGDSFDCYYCGCHGWD